MGTPMFNIPETFGKALSYEGQIHDIMNHICSIEHRLNNIDDNIYTSNNDYDKYDIGFIGRINLRKQDTYSYDYISPQGMCILNDYTMLCAVQCKDSGYMDKTIIYKVNLQTGEIISEFETEFNHANSMCYIPTINAVAVTPCYTYVGTTRTPIEYFYLIDINDMSIIQRVDTIGKTPHSVTYDPITQETFIAFETLSPYTQTVYKFNPVTFELDFEYNVELLGQSANVIRPISFTAGIQTYKRYNGIGYMVYGGSRTCAITKMNEYGNIVDVININNNVSLYKIVELEDIAFNSKGDIYLYGASRVTLYPRMFAVIACMNMFGNKFSYNSYVNFTDIQRDVTHYDPSRTTNYNIYQDGSNFYPYSELCEAVSSCMEQSIGNLTVDNDGKAYDTLTLKDTTGIRIVGNNHEIDLEYSGTSYIRRPISISNVKFKLYSNQQLHFENGGRFENVTFDCSEGTNISYVLSINGDCFFKGCTIINPASIGGTNVNAAAYANAYMYQCDTIRVRSANVATMRSCTNCTASNYLAFFNDLTP